MKYAESEMAGKALACMLGIQKYIDIVYLSEMIIQYAGIFQPLGPGLEQEVDKDRLCSACECESAEWVDGRTQIIRRTSQQQFWADVVEISRSLRMEVEKNAKGKEFDVETVNFYYWDQEYMQKSFFVMETVTSIAEWEGLYFMCRSGYFWTPDEISDDPNEYKRGNTILTYTDIQSPKIYAYATLTDLLHNCKQLSEEQKKEFLEHQTEMLRHGQTWSLTDHRKQNNPLENKVWSYAPLRRLVRDCRRAAPSQVSLE